MQLTRLELRGLFNRYDYSIPLAFGDADQARLPLEEMPGPSVVILHGPNGVGKTTVLNMLDGLLRLDFNVFRAMPFSDCKLYFNSGDVLSVRPKKAKGPNPLVITFKDKEVTLHPLTWGANDENDVSLVEEFRASFLSAIENISFTFIDANRFLLRNIAQEYTVLIRLRYGLPMTEEQSHRVAADLTRHQRRSGEEQRSDGLAARVKEFINRAQVDYRSFFAVREPDLFARIIRKLEDTQTSVVNPKDLLARLSAIRGLDKKNERFGLYPDHWDFDQLRAVLSNSATNQAALNVLSSYVEMLESRVAERQLIAQRLEKFEQLMDDFYSGIHVRVDTKDGLHVATDAGNLLHEQQLSSGEYHLLYLMVMALTTRRRGTVIAIDEPELSMHIAWQRRLVRALIECSLGAEPQFILATHSPDLAADFKDSMISLGIRDT